ncbi:hypothetical protein [Bacteroides mediterraneensis]|uniref:hypothetical protein n=1 Tax=Bacteroides mediterraneensis TaxID=1841856 RepID=UPI000933A9C2|nr:hypothetical protein [Bacteroides mediterraneensis]
MAINTNVKDISVHVDPISFIADIEVLSGNTAQTYNQDTKEYEPDRSLVPCVLMPYVQVSDPEKMMSGEQTVTGVEWYEGVPKSDGSNRIANGENYVISDDGTPTYSLKVKKNVEANTPIDIFAIFTVTDTRKNTEVKVERSVSLYTALYDTKVLNMRLMDQPKGWFIDPTREKADSSGRWMHTISAQLFSGKEEVPDANAAYWWEINTDNSTWRQITQDELDIFISGKDSKGNWTKSLTFDARFVRTAAFRCRAAYYTGTRPSAPELENLQVTSTVKVEMPKTLRASIRQLSGAKINASMSTNVKFECVLTDNKQVITYNDKLFSITWKAKSGKAGVSDKEIGKGNTISFVPSSLGFDKAYSMAVYAEVKMYAVTALVTSGSKVMISNNKAVIATKFE